MSLARTPSTTAGLLRSGAGDAAGLHLVPEPSRVMTALVADLLWPTSLDPALPQALLRRAATVRAGTPGEQRALVAGGRVSHQRRARGRLTPGTLGLSPREREVVQLLAAGLRNKEIALRLQISEKTVKFHLGR